MDAYWASSNNKIELESFFIDWMTHCATRLPASMQMYLGGGHKTEPSKCITLSNGQVHEDIMLKSNIEEADDRILFHVSHIVSFSKAKRVVICSTDTDVFVNSLYHYQNTWHQNGLEELWISFGVGKSERYIPVHCLANDNILTDTIVSTLPALHCLTGCDTTSKISTKTMALKVAQSVANVYLMEFGKQPLTEDMERNAEIFLVRSLGANFLTMDELRFHQFHHKKIKSFQDLVPTSATVRLHIKRSYLQCYRWINALKVVQELDPLDYGYTECEGLLIPQIVNNTAEPQNFPKPCSCQKCFREKICACRVLKIPCCSFCKCSSDGSCNNIY